MKRGKEEQDEVWSRLGDMACFALSGFGFFETSSGTGTTTDGKRHLSYAMARQIRTDTGTMG